MQNLRLLQQSFSEAIFDQHPVDNTIYARIASGGLSAQRRLQVYRNNVYSSYTEALCVIFDVTRQLVGEEFFQYLSHEYIPAHKSTSGNIHHFGNTFADFLTSHPAVVELPYLADVAKLEWEKHVVFHAPHVSIDNISSIQSVPENQIEELVFITHPALKIVTSNYPILTIWRFHQQTLDESSELKLDQDGELVLIFRPQLNIELQALDASDCILLSQLIQQRPFRQVCEHCSLQLPEMDVGRSLQNLIQLGAITGFTLAT